MRGWTRLGMAVAGAAALVVSLGVVAPAHAVGFGLDLTIVKYEWVPRSGNLEVTAKVDCGQRVRNAYWALSAKQRVSAKGLQRITCTGESQRVKLVLDPGDGRFHPGAAVLVLTTEKCVSDFCAGLTTGPFDIRIPPPGQSHPRGVR